MNLNQTPTRTIACVQRGQVDAAIKLFRGLLVSMAHHPLINTELGVLLVQNRTPQDVVRFLNRAVAAAPVTVQALAQLIDSGNRVNAEIAARMMVSDYPNSATAQDFLNRAMEMETVNDK